MRRRVVLADLGRALAFGLVVLTFSSHMAISMTICGVPVSGFARGDSRSSALAAANAAWQGEALRSGQDFAGWDHAKMKSQTCRRNRGGYLCRVRGAPCAVQAAPTQSAPGLHLPPPLKPRPLPR